MSEATADRTLYPPSKADLAVEAVLLALRHDGRKAWLMGPGTDTFERLTAAYAERHGHDVDTFRADFWRNCTPQRVEVVETDEVRQ